jgi:hypothetical protein
MFTHSNCAYFAARNTIVDIPETHLRGHNSIRTLSILGGFLIMMVLDVALGE